MKRKPGLLVLAAAFAIAMRCTVCALVSVALSASAFAYTARTVSVTGTGEVGGVTTFDLAFGEGDVTNRLYLAYGNVDAGAQPKSWENLVEIAAIAPETTARTVPAPTGWGTSVAYLRFFMVDRVDLPYDYAVEALSSSGKEYLDTGVVAASALVFELDFSASKIGGTGAMVFGERFGGGGDTKKLGFWVNNSFQTALVCGSYDSGYVSGTSVKNRATLRYEDAKLFLDGTQVASGSTTAFQGDATRTMFLFASRSGEMSVDNRAPVMSVYGLRIWKGDVPLRDYVPCVKGGVAGLYDRVDGGFVTALTKDRFALPPQIGLANGDFGATASIAATLCATDRPVFSFRRQVTTDGDGRAFFDGTLASCGRDASTADIVIRWGEDPAALTHETTFASGAAPGDFRLALTELAPDHSYYATAYAVSSAGTSHVAEPVAFHTSSAGATGRTLKLAGVNRMGGAVTSFDLRFSSRAETNYLYAAYGAEEGGAEIGSWARRELVAVVGPFEHQFTCPVPEGWGTDAFAIRFYLGTVPYVPYDYDVEYLAAYGRQGIDTGERLRYGETFTLDWRQTALSGLSNEDKGWGVGTSGACNICGGGRRRDSKLSCYIRQGHRYFTPNFPVSALNTTDVFRDVCCVDDDKITYTMTRLVGESGYWYIADSLSPYNGRSYDSGANLYLFRDRDNQYNGAKAIYRATLVSNATEETVFDLVPVVRDGIPCLCDLKTKTLRYNCEAVDGFTAGPRLALPRIGSESFTASSETYSLLGQPVVAAGAVTFGDDYAVTVGWNLVTLGGADSASVSILWGSSADNLVKSNLLAAAASEGPGQGTLREMLPGRTYYARIVAHANGKASDPSALLTIDVPAFPTTGAGNGRDVEVVEVVREGGVARSVRLALANSAATYGVYAVYGHDYGGETTNGWQNVVRVADLAGSETNLTWTLPEGWGTDVRYLRFITLPAEELPFDTCVAYLESTGVQAVALPTNLQYGFSFAVTWRQASLAGLTKEDKGWGTGSGSNYVVGGGRRRDGLIQPYITGANRSFTPEFPESALTTNVVYRDVATVGEEMVDYTMTSVASGTVWTASGANGYGTSFNSGRIALFRDYNTQYAYHGKKAIYDARLTDTRTGADLFRLVPCVVDGVGCFYDIVSGSLIGEISGEVANALVIGPSVAAEPTSFSRTVVADDPSRPLVGDVGVRNLERGDRVTAYGTVVQAGGATCTVTVETSRRGDFSDAVVWICPTPVASGGDFAFELFESDPASPRYITPGATLSYRVKATSLSGDVDASRVETFSTRAASSFLSGSVALSGREMTFTANLLALGANTTAVWVVWSLDNQALDHVTAPATLAFDAPSLTTTVSGTALGYGTVYYAFVLSNGCTTASWTSRSAAQSATLVDATRYRWKKGLASGSWTDASCWESDDVCGTYPTAASTAVFPAGTTAEVACVQNTYAIHAIDASADNLNLTFSGGYSHQIYADAFNCRGQHSRIVLSDTWLRVPGDVRLGAGTTLVVDRAFLDVVSSSSTYVCEPDSHVIVRGNSSYFYTSSAIYLGGAGSTLEVEDARVIANNAGLFLGYGSSGGTVVLRGSTPRLKVSGQLRCERGRTAEGLRFEVPVGGFGPYDSEYPAPLYGPGSYKLGRDSNPAYTNASVRIAVPDASPALSGHCRGFTTRLVSWAAGVDLARVSLERNRWRVNYVGSASSAAPYDWHDVPSVPTPESPLSLGVRVEPECGTVFLVQ